jgi:hypothetical protein
LQKTSAILYFDAEGRENFSQVIRAVRKALKKRPDLRGLKLVVMTATGEGPALLYARLNEYSPKIIAVTFAPDFSVKRGNEVYRPQIPERLSNFFKGVGVKVLTNRLPFDQIGGAAAHNGEMQLIKDVITIFGGGFSLGIQAALSACDHGEVAVGERILCLTGDTATIVSSTTSDKFLSWSEGLVVHEILCKPRNLTISRKPTSGSEPMLSAGPPTKKIIDLPAAPDVKPTSLLKQ